MKKTNSQIRTERRNARILHLFITWRANYTSLDALRRDIADDVLCSAGTVKNVLTKNGITIATWQTI